MAKMKVKHNRGEIKSIPSLLSYVRRARNLSPTGAVWLRGLSDKRYKLIPSIGRDHTFAGRTIKFDNKLERRLLNRFKRYAYGILGHKLTEWEWLFLARHHSLPVRILDWTSNPLAALYFACEFNGVAAHSDGKIWILIPSADHSEHSIDPFTAKESPFEIKGIRLLYPMVVSPRITAQSGYFTIQDDPWIPLDKLDIASNDTSRVDIMELWELDIPAKDRSMRLKELNDLDITHRTLFPDLDGLANGLLTTEILRGPIK
jgi:hypothetical protein